MSDVTIKIQKAIDQFKELIQKIESGQDKDYFIVFLVEDTKIDPYYIARTDHDSDYSREDPFDFYILLEAFSAINFLSKAEEKIFFQTAFENRYWIQVPSFAELETYDIGRKFALRKVKK